MEWFSLVKNMSNTENMKVRLCIVGPMLGRNEGWVTTQGEILADHFREIGYQVLETSQIVNRYKRLIDIIYSLIRWRNQYDLAIINVFSGPAFIVADISSYLLKVLKKPFIVVLHGGNLPNFSSSRQKWVKRVLKRAHRIVSPSRYLSRFCESMDLDVTIIPNTIKLENYIFRERSSINPKLLWMRTFHEIYNPEMAVEVIERMKNTIPDIHLTMAGQEKGRLEFVQRLVREKGLGKQISFIGFLNMQDKRKVFNNHDIYLNTTRIDNTPVSVIEAAAFGLQIISTNVGGIPDLLTENETALLVDNEDVEGMVQAIQLLLRNPGLAEKLSNNGKKIAEACSWKNILIQWENLFFDIKKSAQ